MGAPKLFESALWSLYNKASKAKMTGLTFSQVRALVATFESSALSAWLVWYESLTEWEPLSKHINDIIPDGELTVFLEKPLPPALPVDTQVPTSQAEAPKASDRLVAVDDVRVTRRFQKSFQVIVRPAGGGTSFRTETEDISLSGMKLKAGLPKEFQVPCSFVLANKANQTLEVVATLILQGNEDRTRFNFVRVPVLSELHRWLTDSKNA